MEVANHEYHTIHAYAARDFFQHDLFDSGAGDGSVHVNHYTDPNEKILRLGYLNTCLLHLQFYRFKVK